MSDSDGAAPLLRIVHGSPTDVELAVLTAVVATAGGGDEPTSVIRRGGWNDPAMQHRRALVPGPNAWRATYLG